MNSLKIGKLRCDINHARTRRFFCSNTNTLYWDELIKGLQKELNYEESRNQ